MIPVLATVLLLGSAAPDGDQRCDPPPTVEQMMGLFGKEISDGAVKALAERYGLKKEAKFGSGNFHPPGRPFELSFSFDRIDRLWIVVRCTRPDLGETSYTGTLPFGIRADAPPKRLIKRFGQPHPAYRGLDGRGVALLQFRKKRLTVSYIDGKIHDIFIDADPRVLQDDKQSSRP